MLSQLWHEREVYSRNVNFDEFSQLCSQTHNRQVGLAAERVHLQTLGTVWLMLDSPALDHFCPAFAKYQTTHRAGGLPATEAASGQSMATPVIIATF